MMLQLIPVTLVDNGANGEADETLQVKLSNASNAKLGTNTVLTVTIREGCNPTIC